MIEPAPPSGTWEARELQLSLDGSFARACLRLPTPRGLLRRECGMKPGLWGRPPGQQHRTRVLTQLAWRADAIEQLQLWVDGQRCDAWDSRDFLLLLTRLQRGLPPPAQARAWRRIALTADASWLAQLGGIPDDWPHVVELRADASAACTPVQLCFHLPD